MQIPVGLIPGRAAGVAFGCGSRCFGSLRRELPQPVEWEEESGFGKAENLLPPPPGSQRSPALAVGLGGKRPQGPGVNV